MTRMKNVLGAALLLIPFAAGATTTYTFDSLSKVQYGGGATSVTLTGILLGDSAPSTVGVPNGFTECEGFYKEALNTSGKFLLDVTTDLLPPAFPGGISTLVLVSCSLERKH